MILFRKQRYVFNITAIVSILMNNIGDNKLDLMKSSQDTVDAYQYLIFHQIEVN